MDKNDGTIMGRKTYRGGGGGGQLLFLLKLRARVFVFHIAVLD